MSGCFVSLKGIPVKNMGDVGVFHILARREIARYTTVSAHLPERGVSRPGGVVVLMTSRHHSDL
jgi:hypothetical protein